ncbi:hypothetical protein AC578_5199 [Pseudocercospora eumusae]|uniref:Actin-like ATPase domain-containing protein n=1 Tax=Pseudocercospora eumusae TaxID=321146 RepID=A0A139H0I0_9PEZI|nr:hypothetical protein AC578_5199 [Pseudocercospora eumusae]
MAFNGKPAASGLNAIMQGLQVNDPPSSTHVHRLIVGVDFGTTFTGVSWVSTDGAHVKVLDDVHCVRDWPGPGRDGDYSWKTPSRIAYGVDNGRASNACGFEVLPRMKSYAWMKLLLDPEQATRFDDASLYESEGAGVLSRPFNKSTVELCADFLAEIAGFAYKSLAKRLSPEVLKATPIDFWFTVPAVWSDRAKFDTLRAAQKAARLAKIQCHQDSQVFLIREPEAAAIATLSALTQGGSEQHVKVGDSILVCDCGGGTVDLTSYEITGISPNLAFKELVVGTGGKCGSTYIDREFIRWMENKFGNAYKDLSWEKRGPASRLMKDFEAIKRDFGKSDDHLRIYEAQVYMRDAPDSDYYDEDDGIVTLHPSDIKQMFDPVINKIKDLLQSQLDAERKQSGKVTIKTVLLVGGFGDSTYLNNVIRDWCKQRGLRLLCPEHPQSAIVRGAALSGLLNIQPTSRRSRRHYGFSCHEPFDPLRHRLEDRFIWFWNNKPHASGNMFWELAKGDNVDDKTEITTEMSSTVWDDEPTKTSEMEIYCSDADEPPMFERDLAVKKLAVMRQDFSKLDLSGFPSKTVNGRTVRHITAKYIIRFGHRRGVLSFVSTVNGSEVGSTTVTFDGHTGDDDEGGLGGGGHGSPQCATQ